MKQIIKNTVGAIALSCMASSASALVIDFTDQAVWGTGGSAPVSHTYNYSGGALTVSLSTSTNSFTNTRYDGGATGACLSYGLVCDRDGLGIGDDEITYGQEWLEVSFSKAVNLDALAFLDLFHYTGSDASAENAQAAFYSGVNYSGAETFTGTANNDREGFFTANVSAYTDITSISFIATAPRNSDYALAAISVAEVPEPGSLALLGLGLLGLTLARKYS